MTYADFNAAVRTSVYPDGEPENLVANHQTYVQDALIDLQIKVPRLQVGHTDYIVPEDTLFHCGASLIEAPRGFITGLSVLRGTPTRCCDEAAYLAASKDEFDCFLRDLENCTSWCAAETHAYPYYQLYGEGEYIPYPTLELCTEYPTQNIDSVCPPRSGYFTYFRGQLWMTPHLPSGYVAKLQWDGIKRTFNDTDILDEEFYDREVTECVELYLRGRAAIIDDCDLERAVYFNNENPARPGLYQTRRADLIHTGAKERRLPPRNYCLSTCC